MDDAFQKRLLQTFRMEADEILTDLANGLLDLEQEVPDPERAEILERIFRGAHSLKGAARAVNMNDVQVICQGVEDVFSALKKNRGATSAHLFDVLHGAVKSIQRCVLGDGEPDLQDLPDLLAGLHGLFGGSDSSSLAGDHSGGGRMGSEPASDRPAAKPGVCAGTPGPPVMVAPPSAHTSVPDSGASARIERTSPPADHAMPQASPVSAAAKLPRPDATGEKVARQAPEAAPHEVIRVPVARIEQMRLQAEEMLTVRQRTEQRVTDLRRIAETLRMWNAQGRRRRHAVSVNVDRRADTRDGMTQLERQVQRVIQEAEQDHREMEAMIGQLMDAARGVLMVPFVTLINSVRPLVRDLARTCGKQVRMVVEGEDVEIDKRILEVIKAPLIHLVNNSIDHGLEPPTIRSKRGKPEEGVVSIAVSRGTDGKITMVVADDGAGLDVEAVKATAVRKGIVSEEAAATMDDAAAASLIFASGLTTSEIITNVSGRGLGMAIVQGAVEKIGGQITVFTSRSEGTRFEMILPASLSTLRGVLVREASNCFVIPTVHVEQGLRLPRSRVHTGEAATTIEVEGSMLSLVRLADILSLERSPELPSKDEWLHVLVLRSGRERLAFWVDEVVEERELLARSLGPQLRRVRNVTGVTVLGTGQIVPILNVEDLVVSALRSSATISLADETDQVARRVLVVDDSITTRMLLKNILETSGFDVSTAVDGREGLKMVESQPFDLVVSDIQMPHMDGTEMTSRLRENPALKDIPVILVTSLSSDEDRGRGVKAGANAYFVKSDFDQGTLLDVIDQLI